MLSSAHRITCPNCGGPIEIRIGASRGVVCPFCRFSVSRMPDGALSLEGKVADLVPSDPPLFVGGRGTLRGRAFSVVGRQQLDHGAGPWDELYVAFDDGATRWLSRAQGRWMLTEPGPSDGLPSVSSLSVGATLDSGPFAGKTTFETGRYRVLSAEGELPLPIRSGDTGEYADLEGPGGAFATIDDDGETLRSYVGERLEPSAVEVVDRGRPTAAAAEGRRIRCASCGAPIELYVPQATERVGCSSCGALLDPSGDVVLAHAKDEALRASPDLPIGVEGTLRGERLRVVGYLRKSCVVEGERYYWDEYLLATSTGFAWLGVENGHCTLYVDAARGDVNPGVGSLSYQGRRYRLFSDVDAVVESVVGEMPWKVAVGESTKVCEYIAPPNSVSEERASNELTYSHGTYLPTGEVFAAFGAADLTPVAVGIGTTQPAPHPDLWTAATRLFVAYLVVEVLLLIVVPSSRLGHSVLALPAESFSGRFADAPSGVTLIDEIVVPRRATLEVELDADGLDNAWVESSVSLVNLATGQLYELSLTAESYSGFSDGESWTEGDPRVAGTVSSVPEGRYLVRAETAWDTWPSDPLATKDRLHVEPTLTVSVDGTAGGHGLGVFMLLFLPLVVALVRRASFEQRRWEGSNTVEETKP